MCLFCLVSRKNTNVGACFCASALAALGYGLHHLCPATYPVLLPHSHPLSLLPLQVSILDEPGPSGEVAEEEVKTEDHRVSKSVIALLDEGKRELFGNVLVLPNARLRAVREVVAGTFEEKLQNKPFYLLTTVSATIPIATVKVYYVLCAAVQLIGHTYVCVVFTVHPPLHTTPQHTTLHHTTLQHTAPHHTTPHCTTLHHTAPHHITPPCITPHCITLHTAHHTAPHYTHHTTPHHTAPHYTHHTTLSSTVHCFCYYCRTLLTLNQLWSPSSTSTLCTQTPSSFAWCSHKQRQLCDTSALVARHLRLSVRSVLPVVTAAPTASWKTGNGSTAKSANDLPRREGGQKFLGDVQQCQHWEVAQQSNKLGWSLPLAPWGEPRRGAQCKTGRVSSCLNDKPARSDLWVS